MCLYGIILKYNYAILRQCTTPSAPVRHNCVVIEGKVTLAGHRTAFAHVGQAPLFKI